MGKSQNFLRTRKKAHNSFMKLISVPPNYAGELKLIFHGFRSRPGWIAHYPITISLGLFASFEQILAGKSHNQSGWRNRRIEN